MTEHPSAPVSVSATTRPTAVIIFRRANTSSSIRMAAKYLSPENLDNVEALIDELGLMFVGAEKIEEPEEPGSDDG